MESYIFEDTRVYRKTVKSDRRQSIKVSGLARPVCSVIKFTLGG